MAFGGCSFFIYCIMTILIHTYEGNIMNENKVGLRRRIYEIIEMWEDDDLPSKFYDFFMMGVIALSLIPLFFKQEYPFFKITEIFTTAIFIIDYILRLITADYKMAERYRESIGEDKDNEAVLPARSRVWAFIRYPFTFMALVDLLCILPAFLALNPGFRVLKVIRMIRTFKVFRIFKSFRYSATFGKISKVVKQQKKNLIAVGIMAVGYVVVTSLIMFNIEPETFDNFFDALYWATISLTTMGYGDIYATSTLGQAITMVSAIFGIAIVALPAGIISAGFVDELNKDKEK